MAVPASLHPATISKFRAIDPRSREPIPDAEVDALERAVATLQEAATSIDGMAGAIVSDRTRTPADNVLRLRNGAAPIAAQAAGRLDAALERATAEGARLEAAMRPAGPANAVEIQQHAELRAVLRGMGAKERSAAIAARLAAGDGDMIAAAILNADLLATGMSPSEREMVRHSWRRKRYPAEVERLARLEKAREAATRSGTIFANYLNSTINSPAAQTADKAATRATAALAAGNQE